MGGGASKTAFRASVLKLIKEEIPASEDEFWEKIYWGTGDLDDIFGTIHSDDVRDFITTQPGNLRTLFEKLVKYLETTLGQVGFLEPLSKVKIFHSLINATRLFQRIVPFVYEMDLDDTLANSLFWEVKVVEEGEQAPEPLGRRIVNVLMRMLFVPPHTCNQFFGKEFVPGENGKFTVPDDYIWEKGIDVASSRGSSSQQDRYRSDILRSILVFCSKSMYLSGSEEVKTKGGRFHKEFVAKKTPYTKALFTSMMNVIFSYEPVGYVPFSSSLMNDYRETLVNSALHVVIVFLEEIEENIYASHLKNLVMADDLEFMWKGYTNLLQNPVYIASLYISGSKKEIACIPELLVLFWKLINTNKAFVQYILSATRDINGLIVSMGYILLKTRKDEALLGQVFIITFIFLVLSGEREFGIQLNKKFVSAIKMDLPVFYNGNLFDFLFLVIQRLIVDGAPRLSTLYESFFTIIANVSPYIKSTAMITSGKMMKLLESFSQEKFLLSGAKSYVYMAYILEALQNILQYQYEGNTQLIYAILRQSDLMKSLRDLNFETSLKKWREENQDIVPEEEKEKEEEDDSEGDDGEKEEREEEEELKEESGESEETKEVVDSANDEGGEEKKQDKSQLPAPFVPTKEWFDDWFSNVQAPLSIIMRMIDALYPQVNEYCTKNVPDENAIIQFIKNYTLVGLLPVPHRIMVRKYQKSHRTEHWITTYLWGVIYLRNSSPAIFYGSNVVLFKVTLA